MMAEGTFDGVDEFGDLVPGAVVEVAHLLLVLHSQSRRRGLLLTLGYNQVVDALEILPILHTKLTM